jgi:hypothetical protein
MAQVLLRWLVTTHSFHNPKFLFKNGEFLFHSKRIRAHIAMQLKLERNEIQIDGETIEFFLVNLIFF